MAVYYLFVIGFVCVHHKNGLLYTSEGTLLSVIRNIICVKTNVIFILPVFATSLCLKWSKSLIFSDFIFKVSTVFTV